MIRLRFRGYGYTVPGFLVLGFLLLRPVFEHFAGPNDELWRRQLNGGVVMLAGILSLAVGLWADKRDGQSVYSPAGWISELFDSRHTCLGLPMRLVGILLVIASFLF